MFNIVRATSHANNSADTSIRCRKDANKYEATWRQREPEFVTKMMSQRKSDDHTDNAAGQEMLLHSDGERNWIQQVCVWASL